MYQYLKDICSVMTVVGRHLFQDHWEGLNKKFVSVQDSICYIMLRSALKAINKKQNTILQSFILALYLFIGEGNDNSLQYSCLERIPWTEVGYSTWGHGAEHNWATDTHVYLYFGRVGSSLLRRLSFSWRQQRLLSGCGAQASHCGGFSLRITGVWGSSYCSQALELRLNSCGAWTYLPCSIWHLLGPGIKPMSHALAGGF